MTDDERATDLGSLFESITGETSVVQSQRRDADARTVDEQSAVESVDAIDHHGFADVIDGPEAVGSVA